MASLVQRIIQDYAEAKRLYPAEGRRKWKLRAVQQFWAMMASGGAAPLRQPGQVNMLPVVPPSHIDLIDSQGGLLESTSNAESDDDSDPLDGMSRDAPGLGLVIRTDFSNEPSWTEFCTWLQVSEKELVLGSDDVGENAPNPPDGDGGERDDSDDEDSDGGAPAIFQIINPSSPRERELLTDVSNLTILRLFNDVDIRLSPTPPQGTKRIDQPNRLVDHHGWQETYQGKHVWIYDTKSNTDQCVRVVSQRGDLYGTATGDSWRARVSHICELQVNLFSDAIKIDFGGLDRWDFNERRRNMMEAEK